MPDTVEIVSKGAATAFKMDALQQTNSTENNNTSDTSNGEPNPNGNEQGQQDSTNTIDKPTFSEESFAAYLKENGIELQGGLNELKEKLKPQSSAPTAEEIAAKEAAMEKRMLDLHIKSGGKVEDFVGMKTAKDADVSEMSKALLHQELLSQGFDEDEAKALAKQMYLQDDLDNLEQEEDESEEDFNKRKEKLQKKVQFGADKLANRSLHIKNNAQQAFDNLKREVELEDEELVKEAKYSADVDNHVKSLPKQITLSIGQIDGKDIAPIVYDVPEEIHTEVSALLKDRQKREEFFLDANGKINLQTVTDVLVRNKILENAARATYLKGGTAQVEIFEQRFPARSASAVGVGGTPPPPSKNMGQAVQRGETQKFQPTIKN